MNSCLTLRLAAIVATLGTLAGTAHGTIVSGMVTSSSPAGGTFVLLTPPLANPFGPANSVGNDTFQDQNLYGFNEDQNVLVGPGALSIDYKPGGGAGTIAAGTEVASHYVFFDPRSGSQSGWVEFDSPVLGIVSSTNHLLASDYLANTGVNYLNPAARGLEAGDSAIIDPLNPNRILVDWDASTPGDYIRVLTAHSPTAAPDAGSTIGLMGLSLLALRTLRKKFRKA